jgi:hypothetical protein
VSDFDGETEFIEGVARELRAPVVLTPALDERVMAVVRESPHGARSRRVWLLRPVTFRVTPLAGMLAAAAIAGVAVAGALALGTRAGGTARESAMAPSAAAPSDAGALDVSPASYRGDQQVRFIFLAPAASNVSVVGDFNDWDTGATPLARVDERGIWTVTLPLRPGRYLYMFVVDGTRWAPDPAAPLAPEDGFGVPNSVVTVGGPVS